MKIAPLILALICAAPAVGRDTKVSYIDSAGRLCTRSFIIADDGLVHFDLLERPQCTERRLPKAAHAPDYRYLDRIPTAASFAASAPPNWLDYLPRK